jgi:hypothetical protein
MNVVRFTDDSPLGFSEKLDLLSIKKLILKKKKKKPPIPYFLLCKPQYFTTSS